MWDTKQEPGASNASLRDDSYWSKPGVQTEHTLFRLCAPPSLGSLCFFCSTCGEKKKGFCSCSQLKAFSVYWVSEAVLESRQRLQNVCSGKSWNPTQIFTIWRWKGAIQYRQDFVWSLQWCLVSLPAASSFSLGSVDLSFSCRFHRGGLESYLSPRKPHRRFRFWIKERL